MAKNMMADAGWKWGALTTDTLSKKGKYVSYCWFREELTHGREDSGSGKQTDYASRGLKLWQTYAVKKNGDKTMEKVDALTRRSLSTTGNTITCLASEIKLH